LTSEKEVERPLQRDGFDAYLYLMAYEEDVLEMYSDREDLSSLQKAALHFVEIGLEEKEIDGLKYISTYNDLCTIFSKQCKEENESSVDVLKELGRLHYESQGKQEIVEGKREVTMFFEPLMYIASFPAVQNDFKLDDGTFDIEKLYVTFIMDGHLINYTRKGFDEYQFLANYPELAAEDIYVNKKVNEKKVARIWLDKAASESGVQLDKFDIEDFKETTEIKEDTNPFKAYFDAQVMDYNNLPKKSILVKMMQQMCVAPKLDSKMEWLTKFTTKK